MPSCPPRPRSPERPADRRRFVFDPEVSTVAALDIGARSVRCLVADASGRLVAQASTPLTSSDPLDALERAVGSPGALGIAAPGILGPDGRIAQSLAVPELIDVDLAGELSQRLGCPAVVENDIKLAALASTTSGAKRKCSQLGNRISVAAILDGKILQGAPTAWPASSAASAGCGGRRARGAVA